jgi:hypothetical protein
MKDYYYLLAGLPDLLPAQEQYKIEFAQVFGIIRENLSGNEFSLSQFILYPHDNKNLVRAIAKQTNRPSPYPFHQQPETISEETITNYHKSTDGLPAYMIRFLDDEGDSLSSASITELETKLNDYLFEEAMQQDDDFIREYYQFIYQLNNIKAAYNARNFDYEMGRHLNQDFFINKTLLKNTSSDFGLSQQFPFMESLNAKFDEKKGYELERTFEEIIWEFLDETTRFSFFNRHKLFAYLVKLLMVKRWMDLQPETGKKRLEELTEKILYTEDDQR